MLRPVILCLALSAPALADEGFAFGPEAWDARGYLPCDAADLRFGGPDCPFKVRRGREAVTLWILRPDGSVRELRSEGFGFSTPSADPLTARQDGDTWILRIGPSEGYLVPDVALIGDNPY